MRKSVVSLVGLAAALIVPNMVLAQAGTATGTAAGAIVGGAVGGPVGAAVGAGVGASAGAASDAANQPRTTGTVRERSTTCVQGASGQTCTEVETRTR
jgi:hypothetical protein